MSSGALIPISDLFNQAVEAFSQGDLTRAADLCSHMPIHAPAFGDSLHLAAVIAGRQGDALRAVALIAEFLSLCPADADAWADFTVIANNSGHATAALNAAFRAINLAPNRLDWWQVAARLAMALHRYDLALPGWQLLTANEPQQVDFWLQRALSETVLERSDDAISSLAQVTRLDPANALAFERLGRLLFAGKRLGEAAFAFREWTRLRLNDAHAYLNFGVVLTEMGGEAEAAFACAQSMALEPGLYAAYTNLAAALYLKQLNFLPAYQLLDRAHRLDPQSADVQMNLAVTLQGLGQTGEARLAFHRAAAIRPADPESLYNQSLFELLHGNFRDGLRFYEWRRLAGVGIMTQFDRLMWRGGDLRGRHILIVDEQGLGDTLQFCRYIPMIEKLGARVSVAVRDPLVSLLETLGPNIQVYKNSQAPTDFDCWAHMMSLPYLFGTELHTIPAVVPYLHVPAEFIADAAKDIAKAARKRLGWSGPAVPCIKMIITVPYP